MSIKKTVSFHGPYVGKTFQEMAKLIFGVDGYLSGGATTDNGATITVAPYAFVQQGIICEDSAPPTMAVPVAATPWFIIASTLDDDPATGIQMSVTADVSRVTNAVVIAFKMNGRWYNPVSISARGLAERDAPVIGPEEGFLLSAEVGGGGAVDGFRMNMGTLIDAAGNRRQLSAPVPAEGAGYFVNPAPLAPPTTTTYSRNDYLVLRRREQGNELVTVMGGLLAPPQSAALAILDVAPSTRPAVYGKRGASASATAAAWGFGNNLKGKFGLGVPFNGVIYAGVGAIGNVQIPGQRAADQAVIIVFTEGNALFATAVDENGAMIGMPVVIDTQANAIDQVSAVIDLDGLLHVVYRHDENNNGLNRQVYYTKRSLAAGTFAAAAVTPRLANVVDSTKNDSWPSIGVDRQRIVHIAYSTGNNAEEFGQLRYVVLAPDGSLVSKTTYVDYGHQPDPESAIGVVVATNVVDNIRRPLVVVTPHGEVGVFLNVKRQAIANPDELAVFSPKFVSRLGFSIVLLNKLFPSSGGGADTLQAFGAVSDEHGQFVVAASWVNTGLFVARLDTVFAPRGVLADSYLERPTLSTYPLALSTTGISVAPGPVGDVLMGIDAVALDACVITLVARSAGRGFTPHPNDVYLGGWMVDAPSVPSALVKEEGYQLFSARQKKLSYPVIVGDEGDYQGYGSLLEAILAANRIGGHLVLRGGEHQVGVALVVYGGVAMEGEGLVTIRFIGSGNIADCLTIGQNADLACSVAGSVITMSTVVPGMRIGDLVETLAGGVGFAPTIHRIRRIMAGSRAIVDGAVPHVTTTSVRLYACGNRFENIAVDGGSAHAGAIMHLRNAFAARLSGVQVLGDLAGTEPGILITGCRQAILDNVDVSRLACTGINARGLEFRKGIDNQLRGSLLGSRRSAAAVAGPFCFVHGTTAGMEERSLHVVNCRSVTDGETFYVDVARTSPVYIAQGAGGLLEAPQAGRIEPDGAARGNRFYDDFCGTLGTNWDTVLVNGTATATDPHAVELLADGGLGLPATATIRLKRKFGSAIDRMRFRCRLKLVADVTTRADACGLQDGAGFGFFFLRDTTVSNTFRFLSKDSLGATNDVDTGFTPLVDTWYWLYAAYVSDTKYAWYIGNDLAPATGVWLAQGMNTVAAGTYDTSQVSLQAFAESFAAAQRSSLVDIIEAWTDLRA